MLVTRWQAAIVPDIKQITAVFQAEGLEPFEEGLDPDAVIGDHRHPFDEVRMVASGQMLIDISGNKLLLRAGDRIVIPSNTRHSKKVEGPHACVCICAYKTY